MTKDKQIEDLGKPSKKKTQKSLEFSKLSGPPPRVWKFTKILGFFQGAQKHIETIEYVLIYPEMEKKM